MKVKVIKAFKDKNTKSIFKKGTELEVTEERFSELTAGPLGVFVEVIEEKQEEPAKEAEVPTDKNTELPKEKETKKKSSKK